MISDSDLHNTPNDDEERGTEENPFIRRLSLDDMQVMTDDCGDGGLHKIHDNPAATDALIAALAETVISEQGPEGCTCNFYYFTACTCRRSDVASGAAERVDAATNEGRDGDRDDTLIFAGKIFKKLNRDIQRFMQQEYFIPQLIEDELIENFITLMEGEECQRLRYECLIETITKIINSETALRLMRERGRPYGWKEVYEQHIIEKKNSFTLVKCPITSMAMEFVMRRWH